ncbi:Neuraminidase (sialidase) [Limihaloglobus sulfuriphilus]|uniref:Neuraminidase (Sialidase) n=1 Tax=Limihaloglobus sulfuriphilus TaxID=1851148 RepID=A0A1Q2MFU7_9BACT|nr:exo-alpha-sialidase [Limihaloglobus sulfuriphilus]AQQ71132.1 Neuraminidase (sialidase) [Limihaloglobus sulfuriphilus]
MNSKTLSIDIEMIASMGLDVDDYSNLKDDWRHLKHGNVIPSKTYSDQPYVIKTDDGAWLCVMTTGVGREGEGGQHVISQRSTDKGKTWENIVELEQPGQIEASYAVLLKAPGGRIFCFYNHNTDNVREIIASKDAYPDGLCRRVDSLGYFVFKYSDDHGRSWSDKRYVVDIREMEIDRQNPYQGKIRFFWNVGKPFIHDGAAYVSVHKVGSIGKGFFTRSEGILVKSSDILTESDPANISWETLPDGDHGLRAPSGGGPISEEQSYSVMSDGSFFCVYRTVDGYPACSYSRDEGHTWSEPEYLSYTYKGKKVKNPRAANFAWKCSNGKYLYWFHNHSGKDYENRNPVWMLCGAEKESPEGLIIEWSQPEIIIYTDDTFIRMSYPDLVEENNDIYITETDKETARIHKLNPEFLNKLFNFDRVESIEQDGLILDITRVGINPSTVSCPKLPKFLVRDVTTFDYKGFDLRNGISLDFYVNLTSVLPGQNIFDNRTPEGRGFCVTTGDYENVRLTLNDGMTESCWSSDPGSIKPDHIHHVSIIIDGGPKVITFIIDGKFCDGGDDRQFGWGRFSPNLYDINGSDELTIGKDVDGSVKTVRIYNRAIMSSEAVGNFRATLKNL